MDIRQYVVLETIRVFKVSSYFLSNPVQSAPLTGIGSHGDRLTQESPLAGITSSFSATATPVSPLCAVSDQKLIGFCKQAENKVIP